MPSSSKASTKKLSEQMMKYGSKTKEFNNNLNEFAKANGINEAMSKKSIEELGKIRLKNPKQFDEMVFQPKTQSTPITNLKQTP